MPWSRQSLTELAAIAAALPHVPVALRTSHGATVVVGEHPRGAMCADGFRRLMAAWVDGCEPDVEAVEFVGARLEAGMVCGPGSRVFATSLDAHRVAQCLRARTDWPESAHATVREDLLLGLSVVHVQSTDLAERDLDFAARVAHGACLVEELCLEVAQI